MDKNIKLYAKINSSGPGCQDPLGREGMKVRLLSVTLFQNAWDEGSSFLEVRYRALGCERHCNGSIRISDPNLDQEIDCLLSLQGRDLKLAMEAELSDVKRAKEESKKFKEAVRQIRRALSIVLDNSVASTAQESTRETKSLDLSETSFVIDTDTAQSAR